MVIVNFGFSLKLIGQIHVLNWPLGSRVFCNLTKHCLVIVPCGHPPVVEHLDVGLRALDRAASERAACGYSRPVLSLRHLKGVATLKGLQTNCSL